MFELKILIENTLWERQENHNISRAPEFKHRFSQKRHVPGGRGGGMPPAAGAACPRRQRRLVPSGSRRLVPSERRRLVPGGRGGLSPAAGVACPQLADAQAFEVELAVRPQGLPWVDRRRPGWCHRRGLRRSGTYVRTYVVTYVRTYVVRS